MSFANFDIHHLLITFSLILFFSVLASKLSVRLGVPTLIFFLLVGMIAKRLGLISASPEVAKVLGVITLVLILFLGGLETDVAHARPIFKSGLSLSTIGAFMTTMVVGLFLKLITLRSFQFSLVEGMLIGAIVASTDAAAVFSILRTRQLRLKNNLGPLLEMESGSNDVMVYFLMTVFLGFLKSSQFSTWRMAGFFLSEMLIGTLGGLGLGYTVLWIVNKINLKQHGLYPTFTLSMLFASYGFINLCHGSGFLAVYIMGIILGNHDFLHKRSFIKFAKGLEWLFQIVMFAALGVLVSPEKLLQVMKVGLLLSFVLIVIARPLSVFLGLSLSNFNYKHKAFISWVGLRGAVPIVFATYLYALKDKERADTMFHLIFFVVLVSILLQGTTLHKLAQWLGLEDKRAVPKKYQQILALSDDVKKMLVQLEVPVGSPIHEKTIVDLNLSKEVLIVLVFRNKRYFTPSGNTPIQENDTLFVMVDSRKELNAVKNLIGSPM